jgi:hypothetical protein
VGAEEGRWQCLPHFVCCVVITFVCECDEEGLGVCGPYVERRTVSELCYLALPFLVHRPTNVRVRQFSVGEIVVHCVILTVQPSNEVHQLLLQYLDIVIGFAGGGGVGHRENHSWERGEGAANDHQQEIHGVGEMHVRRGRASGNGGMVLLLRCWLICNSGVVVVVVFGEEKVQSLADEFLDGAWFVGHRCARQSLLGCFGQQEKLDASVNVPLVLNVSVRQEADPRVSHVFFFGMGGFPSFATEEI